MRQDLVPAMYHEELVNAPALLPPDNCHMMYEFTVYPAHVP